MPRHALAITVLGLIFTAPALAHPGGLDRHGCHLNHDAGEYHCHRDGAERRHTGESKGVVTVIDGDSLQMRKSQIRLHGIDAVEPDQICRRHNGEEWPCGREAMAALAQFVGRQTVTCIHHGRDSYGRTIATCSVPSGSINEWMVRNGWAVAYRRYSHIYAEIEAIARRDQRNIWSGTFKNPELHRRDK